MGNNSVPKFMFRLSRFPVNTGSVLGRFYCSLNSVQAQDRDRWRALVNAVMNIRVP